MLEPMKDLLVEAKRGGYAVPAPNVFDKESVEAAFNAAEELDSPVILDVGSPNTTVPSIRVSPGRSTSITAARLSMSSWLFAPVIAL